MAKSPAIFQLSRSLQSYLQPYADMGTATLPPVFQATGGMDFAGLGADIAKAQSLASEPLWQLLDFPSEQAWIDAGRPSSAAPKPLAVPSGETLGPPAPAASPITSGAQAAPASGGAVAPESQPAVINVPSQGAGTRFTQGMTTLPPGSTLPSTAVQGATGLANATASVTGPGEVVQNKPSLLSALEHAVTHPLDALKRPMGFTATGTGVQEAPSAAEAYHNADIPATYLGNKVENTIPGATGKILGEATRQGLNPVNLALLPLAPEGGAGRALLSGFTAGAASGAAGAAGAPGAVQTGAGLLGGFAPEAPNIIKNLSEHIAPNIRESGSPSSIQSKVYGTGKTLLREQPQVTPEMAYQAENMALNVDHLPTLDELQQKSLDLRANPKGKTAQQGIIDAQKFVRRAAENNDASAAFSQIADEAARSNRTSPRLRAYVAELEKELDHFTDESYTYFHPDALKPATATSTLPDNGPVAPERLSAIQRPTNPTAQAAYDQIRSATASETPLPVTRAPVAPSSVVTLEPPPPVPPASSGAGAGQSPIQKLSDALKAAKKVTPQQEAMFAAQRSQQAARGAGALESGTGSQAFQQARGAMAGAFDRPQFTLPEFSPADVNALSDTINNANHLTFYDKINAEQGLSDLLAGKIPQPYDLGRLTDAFKNDPGFIDGVQRAMRAGAPPGLKDYLGELWMNNVLSGPLTHARNFLGNMASTVTAPLERGLAAGIDQPLAALQGRQAAHFWQEVPAEVAGYIKGLPEGLSAALQTMKNGYNPMTARADIRQTAWPGLLGRLIRTPSTALEAGDQFWRAILYRGELNAEAVRSARTAGLTGDALENRIAELMTNPPAELIKKAGDIASYRLFRAPPGDFTQKLLALRNAGSGFGLQYIIPFVTTPVNLAKFGIERSPLGFFNAAKLIAAKDPQAADALARAGMGSLIAAGIAAGVASGQIDLTVGTPTSSGARDLFYREGNLPFSLKLGNHWVQYSQLQPLNESLTMVAAAIDAMRNGGNPQSAITQAAVTIGQNLANQTYMTGLQNLMQAITDPGTYGDRLINRTAQGFVPASSFLRQATNVIDPTIRKPQGLKETIESGIPGLQGNVPPSLNAFGQENTRAAPFSPIQVSAAQTSAVDSELERLGVNVGFVGKSLAGYSLNRDQQQIYQQVAGQRVYAVLASLLSRPEYATMSEGEKQIIVNKAVNSAKDSITSVIDKVVKSDGWKSYTPEQQSQIIDALFNRMAGQ